MKHLKGKTNLSGWVLGSVEKFVDDFHMRLDEQILEMVAEALHYQLVDGINCLTFDVSDDPGGQDEHPLTMRFSMDIGHDIDDPSYAFNLREEMFVYFANCVRDGSHIPGLKRLSAGFRAFADEIDDVVSRGEKALAAKEAEDAEDLEKEG